MRILIVNCSPVRTGATAAIAEYAASCLHGGNEIKKVCIDDYSISFCKGCRRCHTTARCWQQDDAEKLMDKFAWADVILAVSPSYWADIPGQFKAFIDRCTPWCNTHEPHASIPAGKRGCTIALRTGPGMRECERIISSIEHFYGHLEIQPSGSLGLCNVEQREDMEPRKEEIADFCARFVLNKTDLH